MKPIGRDFTRTPDFSQKSRRFFDQRYLFTSERIYFPHQPIYGFSRLKEHLHSYRRTYSILKALEGLSFSSFLDVGCAEGYSPNVLPHLFGPRSHGTDFLMSAIQRAREIYGTLELWDTRHACHSRMGLMIWFSVAKRWSTSQIQSRSCAS